MAEGSSGVFDKAITLGKKVIHRKAKIPLSEAQIRREKDQSQILQAYTVLVGNGHEPQFSSDPNYYYGLPAKMEYFRTPNGEHILVHMHSRVQRETGNKEAAENFASMINDIPVLEPARVVETVYGLALNNWKYTDDLAERIKDDKPILSEDQIIEIRKDLAFPDFGKQENVHNLGKRSAELKGKTGDDTLPIKQAFQNFRSKMPIK